MNRGLAAKLSWTEIDPETARLQSLTARLTEHDGPADAGLEWPGELWSALEHAGVTRWSISEEFGGEGCPRPLLVQRYAQLAGGSLTAVFILSQHDAGVRRLLAAPGSDVAARWLTAIGRGLGSSRVDLQACKLEYSIVSPK